MIVELPKSNFNPKKKGIFYLGNTRYGLSFSVDGTIELIPETQSYGRLGDHYVEILKPCNDFIVLNFMREPVPSK